MDHQYNINSSTKYKYLSIKNTAICDQEKQVYIAMWKPN